MHRLMISPTEPEITRRAFLLGASAVTILALSGVGTTGAAHGFGSLPRVKRYTATAGRFRRTAAGFVRCGTDEERLCYNPDGTFRGQYLQAADTYNSAPWDDVTALHGASDPAFLTSDSGNRIRYAGEHAEADIFGTAGKGVIIRNEITNQFHVASNIALTGLAAGDLLRVHAIVAIDGASTSGRIEIGFSANAAFGHTFIHDASGTITGQIDSLSSRRAGFHDMGLINGKRWWYLWVDVLATNTTNAPPRIGFGNLAAQPGKSCHVCELMVQRNPASAPAAVPVCAQSKTFAADTLKTALSKSGYVLNGLAMARSQMTSGDITPPPVNIGVPYEPLETSIEVFASPETGDRWGIMPNVNEGLYSRPFRNPQNFSLFYGPGFFPRRWLRVGEDLSAASACVNATVAPVFEAREDLRPILGPQTTSSTFLTGNLTVDKCILLGVGDPRVKYMEQADVLAATGSTFFLNARDVSVKGALVLGGTLHTTRARHLVQQDDSPDHQVHVGELACVTAGGTISLKGTRVHAAARTVVSALADTTNYALDTDQFCATRFWMDQLFIGRGTITNWSARQMFGALTTARTDMFFCQSERPIRVSTNSGGTWGDLPPSFDVTTMPHGFLAEHIGVWNFDTNSLGGAPDPTKSLRVRYWQFDSIVSPAIQKPGFQFLASQMVMDGHTRYPTSGDVFRIKNGAQWIDVTYQGGEWRSGGYLRYTGASANNPNVLNAAISNDFVQINRTNVTATTSNIFDGCVMIGPKGAYFLTGDPALGAIGSALDNFVVRNALVISNGTNSLRWDHSVITGADCLIENALFVEARSDFTYNDGQGGTLTFGGAGARNVLTIGSNVTAISSAPGGGLLAAQNNASYVNAAGVRTITAGRRGTYSIFAAADSAVSQYLLPPHYDAEQGRARLPAYGDLWKFNLTAFADLDAGFGIRAVIAAAKGNHVRWEKVIEDLAAHYHREPDHYVRIPHTIAVGATLTDNISASAFHARYGGNAEGYFAIANGALQVARPLTGLDRIFVLRGSNDEMLVVDVGP